MPEEPPVSCRLRRGTFVEKGDPSVKRECFSEFVDHGHGKFTLFGRVLAETPGDLGRQNTRLAVIAIPPGLDIDRYVVSATFVTEDSTDANCAKPFFPYLSERSPDGQAITVVASRRRDDANPSQYVCDYIVMATTKT
jgi:hypothetical protein